MHVREWVAYMTNHWAERAEERALDELDAHDSNGGGGLATAPSLGVAVNPGGQPPAETLRILDQIEAMGAR